MLLIATTGVALCAASVVRVAGSQPPDNRNNDLSDNSIIDGMIKPTMRWRMPNALRELSGLAVSASDELLAHDDERGVVFVLDPANGKVRRSFALGAAPPNDDFEGIAVVGARIFLITSAGRLYETSEPASGVIAQFSVTETGLGRVCELEGLAFDPATRDLLIGCKTPRVDSLRGRITVLRWSIERRAVSTPISVVLSDSTSTQLEQSLRDKSHRKRSRLHSIRFSTSALEYDPKTAHIVLVAGIEKMLLEITRDGHVVATRALSKVGHPQPEGLTFLGDSLLLISDEGTDGPASISVYRRTR